MRRNVTIVLYHHISDEDDALVCKLGVETPPCLFERHMRYFATHFDFVGADDLISGVLPRKPILVTFDDAYRSVLDVAGPVLKSLHAPSMFFLNPATIAGRSLPIDNVLSYVTAAVGFQTVLAVLNLEPTSVRSVDQLIGEIVPRMKLRDIAGAKMRLCEAAGTSESELRSNSRLFLSPEDIPMLAKCGMEVGNHSTSHTFLRGLSDEELELEVVQSRRELEAMSGRPVRHFSIPYGDQSDATDRAVAAVRRSGHEATYLVHAKSNRFRRGDDIFYRVSTGKVPTARLGLELGALPLMRTVRDWL